MRKAAAILGASTVLLLSFYAGPLSTFAADAADQKAEGAICTSASSPSAVQSFASSGVSDNDRELPAPSEPSSSDSDTTDQDSAESVLEIVEQVVVILGTVDLGAQPINAGADPVAGLTP